MNTLNHILTQQEARAVGRHVLTSAALRTFMSRKQGKYAVKLSNVGNPDFRQDSRRPLPGTVSGWGHVDSLAECCQLCRLYTSFFDLGCGNWSGGEVTCDGVVIGRVSYNGLLFDTAGNEVEVSS